MTFGQFGAHAPITRPPFATKVRGGANVRIAWLLARFVRREPVRAELYISRFGGSVHAYRRDLAALRAARIYRGHELLGNDVR